MSVNSNKYGSSNGREGVAILIVIAMLSTLMLAATAFSISMRVERKGAANYRHSVMARHLLWASLSKAMRVLDESMDDGRADFDVYPDWTVGATKVEALASVGTPLEGQYVRARVLTDKSLDYVPGSLWPDIKAVIPYWDHVYSYNKPGAGGGRVVNGRCAYVIANVSGLLDGNMVGGTNRSAGASVAELQPKDGMNWMNQCFVNRNFLHHRYESLSEMKKLNYPLYEALGGQSNGFAHVFSSSHEGERMEAGNPIPQPKINIGGTEAEIMNKETEIMAALEKCGMTDPVDRAFFFYSLMDYIDEDCDLDPNIGVNLPNTEAFTMINELPVELLHRANSKDVKVTLQLEFIYPFLNARPEKFDYTVNANYTLTYEGINYAGPLTQTADIGYAKEKATAGNPLFYMNQIAATVTLPNVPTTQVDVVISGDVDVKKNGGADLLDELKGFNLTASLPANPGTARISVTNSWECGDPRFNWDFTRHWKNRWLGSDPTPNAINAYAASKLSQAAEAGFDDDYVMYVADTGRLRNVGELGCILRKPDRQYAYKTLKTYNDPDSTKVFEEFTTTKTAYRRGLINANSTSSNVWSAIFRDVPLGAPDPDNTAILSSVEASAIGGSLANIIAGRASPFLDVSEFMADVDWESVIPGFSSLERELMISSCEGVLTVRQNTFIILLAAEKYVPFAMKASGGKSMASTYAVATVCRDPFRDGYGRHKMYVRSFNLLSQ